MVLMAALQDPQAADEQLAAAPAAPTPPPAPPLHTLALRLPDGRVLQRWRQLGEAAYVRDGAGAFAVVVDAIAARCAIAGLDYVDEEPGRSAEQRRDLLDAWLVERGACALDV